MNRLILLTSILLFSLSLYIQSEETSIHPIDKALAICLEADSSQTTAGMIKCTNLAIIEWDKELNNNYKLLMSILDPLEKEKLKSSQLKWIDFRDKELDFSNAVYNKLEGTMWLVVRANRKLELVKNRAIELKEYYDLLITYSVNNK